MYCNLFTAWYCLGVLAIYLVVCLILLPIVGTERAVHGSFGLMGLMGFLPFFWFIVFRKAKYDERDISIMQRSIGTGFAGGVGILFPLSVLVYYAYWLPFKSDVLSIPIRMFWLPLNCAVFIGVLAASFTLLFYYKGDTVGIENTDKEG